MNHLRTILYQTDHSKENAMNYLRTTAIGLLCLVSCFFSAPNAIAAGAANDHTVLILGPTVSGGASSREALAATALGLTVEVATAAQWGAKSSADFGTYIALIMGDATCTTIPAIAAAEANRTVWSPMVNGNIIINGTDPVYHNAQGGASLTAGSVKFAASRTNRTGLYLSLSCYYDGISPTANVLVRVLDQFGTFRMNGVGCYNIAHIVATHPALTGITDATLSNWSCSVHEAFSVWPSSDFQVLAIAQGIGAVYTASDGSVGTPYILARGVTLISSISLNPAEATNEVNTAHTVCATLTTNLAPVVGNTVTFTVTAGPNTGVNGTSVTDSNGIACFTYVGTGGVGVDTIRADATIAGKAQFNVAKKTWVSVSNNPPVATGYPGLVVNADPTTCTANVSADNGSSDPDGDPITVTATPPAPYPLGTNVVQLCVTDSKGASNCTTSIIIVQDVSAPTVICPADITTANDAGQCSAVVTYVASASDCGGLASFVCVPTSGSVFPVGTNVVTCTAVDAAGNTNSCSFNVVVQDTTPPDITCPANIVVANDPGQCSAVVNYTVTATDNCTTTCGVNVDVYSGFTLTGGGAPYSGLLGSFAATGVSFATDTGFNWHPFSAFEFGAVITGCITVAAEGDYVFGLDSDDGSLLGIDGALVVDNGGPHAPGSGFGPSVHLTAGVHSFEVQFFECCGGPSGVDVVLPAGVTFGGVQPVTVVCNPPSGSTFPKGTTTVVCTATDAAGNTNTCSFDVTVEDREAPVGACREGANPSGKKIPVAGKNPASGQNPDGFYQLLSKDNCDSDPAIYLADTGSTFIAGPFHNGDVVKLTQSPGRTPSQDPGAGTVVAHLHFKGDGVLYAVDADGNTSETCLCLVPRPPK
jgi:hypothetical protein